MRIEGKASTQPIEAEDTAEARARNRRVEIQIMQGKPMFSDPISVLEPQ
jgi:chemotaxis protein MotB